MPDGIDAFNQSPGVPITCADCGSHFMISPGDSLASAVCDGCGGKRFFRTQPSPIHDDLSGDNIMKDMPGAAGSDSPMDTGGNPMQEGTITSSIPMILIADLQAPGLGTDEIDVNGLPIRREPGTLAPNPGNNPDLARGIGGFPLSEGTIVGDDGEPSIHADTHGYDGYTHSSIKKASKPIKDANGTIIHQGSKIQDLRNGTQGIITGFQMDHPPMLVIADHNNGAPTAYAVTNDYICPQISVLGDQMSLFAAYPNQHPNPEEMYPDPDMQQILLPNGNYMTAPNPGSDGTITPNNINYTDSTHLPSDIKEQFGIEPNEFGPIHQGNLQNMFNENRETFSMDPYPALWSDEHVAAGLGDMIKNIGKGALALAAPVDQEMPGLDVASDAALAGMAGKIAPTIMKGVGFKAGENAVGSMFGGGNAGGTGMYPGTAQAPTMQQLGSTDIPMILVADLETPGTVKSVDEQHDDPQDQDQKEFDDGDKSPSNLKNPNNEDSGASGEDGVRDATPGYGFGPNSPSITHLVSLMPLLMHYLTNGITGEDDPILQDLHSKLDSELPGYLNNEHPDGPKMLEVLIQNHKKPKSSKIAIQLPTVPTPDSDLQPVPDPGNPTYAIDMRPQQCPACGGVTNQDGSCPQCGFPQGGTGFPAGPELNATNSMQSTSKTANGQGPQTPEQYDACVQWLQQNGKQDLVQQLYESPENFGWLMNEIQNNSQPTAPLTQPQTTMPAPTEQAPGAMPMPDMSQAGGGSGQMQPMSAFKKHTDANNMVPRCPKCKSATTSIIDTVDGNDNKKTAECHSCGYHWDLNDDDLSEKKPKAAMITMVALANPLANPQPTWTDTQGNEIVEGNQYLLTTNGYPVPDEVTIIAKKPDELIVSFDGANFETSIKAEDLRSGKYSLQPSTETAADQTPEPKGGQLDNANVVPEPTTDEITNMYPNGGATVSHVELSEDICPNCNNTIGLQHTASSEITVLHECSKCGNTWETKDEDEYSEGYHNASLDWIKQDDSGFFDEMDRAQMMRETSGASRNIHDIADRDPRLSIIHETLKNNKMQREAGKHFTQAEKRELISENGRARNYNSLDLANTHYKIDDEYISRRKGNGLDVPDAHLFLGI